MIWLNYPIYNIGVSKVKYASLEIESKKIIIL